MRNTSFWVYDPVTRRFGPGKFVGYRGMSFELYEDGVAGNATGAPFDGHLSRTRVARVLANDFVRDPALAAELRKWAASIGGSGSLDGVDSGKWVFARLAATSSGAKTRSTCSHLHLRRQRPPVVAAQDPTLPPPRPAAPSWRRR